MKQLESYISCNPKYANMTNIILCATIFVAICNFICVQSLECGIEKTSNEKDLRHIAENCMKKKSDESTKKPKSSDEESEEINHENSTQGYKNIRHRRHDNSQDNSQDNSDNKRNMDSNKSNNSTGKENCVVNCIFNQLGMLDSNGFPDHSKVAQALMKNTNNRELRDFIQDTTDDCFQLMDQGEQQEPCQYSITLVTCLSERGKANCADWPIGNLSFLSNKNQ